MLNSAEIWRLIEEQQLVTDFIDLDVQLQPSGFDLSLGEVLAFAGSGSVDFSNEERVIADSRPLSPDYDGWYCLPAGSYTVVYNEAVAMPLDVVAIARTRSTLLRNGRRWRRRSGTPGTRGGAAPFWWSITLRASG